jgi:glycosyltransferase involved in cell wall biosynthesis
LQYKIQVIHDGIDTEFFQRRPVARDVPFHNVRIGPNTKVVTYASPGLESWRGFDIFMQVADRLSRQFDDIVFLIAGEELTQYGHEGRVIAPHSFKEHVLSRGNYDLSKFHFLGRIQPSDLVTLFSLSDVHVYLTVPFVVSWSLLQAMSTECTIIGSNSPPVAEVCLDNTHGLLADFYDVEGLTARAAEALRDPKRARQLGAAARAQVVERFEQRRCLGQLVSFFEDTARGGGAPGLS